jgi:site-specific recombinase XerC
MEIKAKKRKSKKDWPRIRKRGDSWMVDCGKVFGARIRKTYKTLEEAEAYAAEQRAERESKKVLDKHERKNRAVSLANLTDSQRSEVLEAYRLLNRPRGLVEAVSFFLKHSAPAAGEMTLEVVYDSYLAEKMRLNRREKTLKDIKDKLGAFVLENKQRCVHTITTADVEAFLDERGKTASTRNSYRTAMNGLFNFALKKGGVERNIVFGIGKASTESKRPEILTVKETAKLIAKAEAIYPELVPYLAIGLFAGLRPQNELPMLDWKNINLKRKTILVEAATAKKRRDRYVEIQPNLARWLTPHKKDEGTVYYSRRKLRKLLEKAGIKWQADIMRHSFASYHMAHFNDDALTARQLGHTAGSSILFEHYKKLVEPREASKFWTIAPTVKKVIQLHVEAA